MDLDLPPPPRTLGRPRKQIEVDYVRDLEVADIALLETERGVKAPGIVQLRDSHHALARCLSSGMRPAEASLVTGYSLSRISILQGDASFKELLEFYRTQTVEVYADIQERMSMMSLEALAELQERFHEHPESFSHGLLLEISKTYTDRTGHGPSTKSTSTVLHLNIADKLERARQRVIEHKNDGPTGPDEVA
jgi:hypothetical protein